MVLERTYERASLIKEQKSNFESGNGCVDLIIKSGGTAGNIVIMELRHCKKIISEN